MKKLSLALLLTLGLAACGGGGGGIGHQPLDPKDIPGTPEYCDIHVGECETPGTAGFCANHQSANICTSGTLERCVYLHDSTTCTTLGHANFCSVTANGNTSCTPGHAHYCGISGNVGKDICKPGTADYCGYNGPNSCTPGHVEFCSVPTNGNNSCTPGHSDYCGISSNVGKDICTSGTLAYCNYHTGDSGTCSQPGHADFCSVTANGNNSCTPGHLDFCAVHGNRTCLFPEKILAALEGGTKTLRNGWNINATMEINDGVLKIFEDYGDGDIETYEVPLANFDNTGRATFILHDETLTPEDKDELSDWLPVDALNAANNIKARAIVQLGGRNTGLQFSEFGYWSTYVNLYQGNTLVLGGLDPDGTMFTTGVDAYEQPAPSDAVFAGNAYGLLKDNTEATMTTMSGTATLTLAGGHSNLGATLANDIDANDIYNVAWDSSSWNNLMVNGVSFETFNLRVNYYGQSAATEAVGIIAGNTNGWDTIFQMSFGATLQP
jgi:hypothetical protein